MGSDASRVGHLGKGSYNKINKGSQTALITRLSVSLCLINTDAGRVAPIRGSV